jgi:hypothetical protein
MPALPSLVVRPGVQPLMCETVIPGYVHPDAGEPPSLLTRPGSVARRSLDGG